MPRRRKSVTPHDPERVRAVRQTTESVFFILSLTAGIVALAGILRRWPVQQFLWWSLAACLGSALLLGSQLAVYALSIPERRAKSLIWANVDALVRDGIRIVSVAYPRTSAPSDAGSPVASLNGDATSLPTDVGTPTKDAPPIVPPTPPRRKGSLPADADARCDELLGIFAAFPVTLQHHLLGTRAIPHAPTCDLLPLGYLASLKRTEARVRFAATHAGPSGSGSIKSAKSEGSADLPGTASGSDEDSDAVTPAAPAKKSNLQMPYPSNVPLALLYLMDVYIVGLGSLPAERGGWASLHVERALDVTKGLNAALSQAEHLSKDTEPPTISLHTRFRALIICWSLWMVAEAPYWYYIALVPAVAYLYEFALRPLLSVPEPTSKDHPLNVKTNSMLHTIVETCPQLARSVRSRRVARLGASSNEVAAFDRHIRLDREEWLPTFT